MEYSTEIVETLTLIADRAMLKITLAISFARDIFVARRLRDF